MSYLVGDRHTALPGIEDGELVGLRVGVHDDLEEALILFTAAVRGSDQRLAAAHDGGLGLRVNPGQDLREEQDQFRTRRTARKKHSRPRPPNRPSAARASPQTDRYAVLGSEHGHSFDVLVRYVGGDDQDGGVGVAQLVGAVHLTDGPALIREALTKHTQGAIRRLWKNTVIYNSFTETCAINVNIPW